MYRQRHDPRRRAATLLLVVATACTSAGKPVPRIGPVQSELSRDQQIDHVLSRLTYGARLGDTDRVRSMGIERWIALQLSPERIEDTRSDSALATYDALNVPPAELTAVFREARMARRDTSRR